MFDVVISDKLCTTPNYNEIYSREVTSFSFKRVTSWKSPPGLEADSATDFYAIWINNGYVYFDFVSI